ncbi:complement decay-accelerating factor-like isoform X5 [Carassius auratus]|uniref:Complement decay-accelerating factor-like isoform X5 n=1 Tax=Carassius auratus TaxID=7957 RepID=A0A6P6PMT8_CARAU|nr:complement decay-accelerating factor-like isoform X5 [Carassius auratus]
MTSVKAWSLLLLPFSLVSMGKAECPVPSMNGKFVLSLESILKNSFADDSEALLECAKGYERDKGPTSITCVNGVWSEVKLICKKVDCGQPKPSPHMTYSIRDGTLFGAYIQPVCETGYDLEGSSHRQCLVSGWSGKAECILSECDFPDPIEHGERFGPENPVFNDVITYSCNDKYTLVGNSSITCGEYGEYSSPPPICIVMTTPTEASTTTNKATTTDTTTVSTRSHGEEEILEKIIIITLTKASTTTNKATTTDMTTASNRSHGRIVEKPTNGSSSIVGICIVVIFAGIVVICILGIVVVVVAVVIWKYLKQRGSYDTGEELRAKEDLLLIQSV